jgi:hypothetical protein
MKKIFIIAVLILIVAGSWAFYRFKIKPKGSTQRVAGADHFGFVGLYGSKDYELAKAIGVGWIRPQIVWQMIEPKDNQFNFDKFDKLYNDYSKKYNFKVMVSLRTGQLEWATKADLSLCQFKNDAKTKGCPDKWASLPPKDLENSWNAQYGYSKNYYDFISKTVEHFKGRVDYFIIENEVNTLTFWHGTADEYLKLRATAYKAAHDANSDVKIIDNGLASLAWINAIIREKYCAGDKTDATNFFRLAYLRTLSTDELEQTIVQTPIDCQNPERQYQIVKAVLKEPTFDILSFHFYEPWQAESEVILWLKNEMEKNGFQKPIICTEGGFFDRLHDQEDQATQKSVAEDLIKLQTIAFAEGVEKFFWLPLSEQKSGSAGREYKGLYATNYQKRPAMTAYSVFVKKIGNFEKAEEKDVGAGIKAFQFIVNHQPLYILWTNGTTTVDLSSDVGDKVKITQVDGSTTSVSGKSISISQSPIFAEKAE